MLQRDSVVKATAWVAVGRVFVKLIAVLQLVIFGRCLGPEVISVFAVAALVLSIVEMLTEQGLSTALIQKQGDISQYLSTVWVVNVLRGAVIAIALLLISGRLAQWFSSPESAVLIAAIGLVPLIRGFENLANVIYSKALDFRRLVVVELTASVIGFLAGVIWLYWVGGAASLVVVAVVVALVNVVGSYRILPQFHGCKFSLEYFRELQRYGLWVMLSRYAAVGLTKGGGVAIGTFTNPISLSFYQYADQFATSATMEISRLANRVALPLFSRSQADRKKLAESFERAFSVICFVSILSMSLLVGNAQLLVTTLLGKAWLPVASLVPWIALWGVTRSLGACVTYGLMAVGKPRAATVYQWTMFLIFVTCVYPVAKSYDAVGVAALLACIGLVIQVFRYPMVSREIGVSVRRLLLQVSVPIVAAGGACMVNFLVLPALVDLPEAFALCTSLFLNFVVYCTTLCFIWRLFPTVLPFSWSFLMASLFQRLGRD